MSKLTPQDSAQQTAGDRVTPAQWQDWIARIVPVLYLTILTISLPTILTQSFVVSELAATQEQKLQHKLRSLSIRVLAHGETIGSGVLLHRHQQVYTVVTNAHVIQAASAPFQLQTHDGQIYATALVRPPTGQNRDLSILRFQTNRTYAVAKLATTSPKIGDRVWLAGFPLRTATASTRRVNAPVTAAWGLETLSSGVTQILPVALAGGYTIGFDRGIKKGMSGGPALDRSGNLVGINGVHANPLWEMPEVLEDGSTVGAALQEQINNSSWAIPIEFVKEYSRF
ncbi:serine protease [Chamaesiphon sp.]|uniref:S1 family peptidase n=1 Tax=Chamaesiphon sp. TaxID=2814140 RepID=UPI0035947D57